MANSGYLVAFRRYVRGNQGLVMRRDSKDALDQSSLSPLQYTVRRGLAQASRKLLLAGADFRTRFEFRGSAPRS